MAFADKLSNIIANLPADDPLFGGLVPRREERPLERTIVSEEPVINRPEMRMPVRRTGMDRVNEQFINRDMQSQNQQARPGNVRLDYSEQELDLARRKQGLDYAKFGYEQNKNEREFGLKNREQNRKETDDRNRLDIDLRKQALEEWKTNNPEGQVETDANGRIVVIDKRTGKSIDTGLKGEHLSEEEKLKLQHGYRMTEIGERNKGRARNISASQQRIAERDAFNEVMNSGKYKELFDKGLVELGDEGNIVINRPSSEDAYSWWRTQSSNDQKVRDVQNINNKIKEFEAEWKAKSEERLNKVFGGVEDDMVDVTTHDGRPLRIPRSELEEFEATKAKAAATSKPMPKVRDDIELHYDDEGNIIGAGNRKTPRVGG